MVLHPLTSPLLDHVELATAPEAAAYLAAVVLWLAGVTLLVLRKLRTSR